MKNEDISKACEHLYIDLIAEGYDVLFDDRTDASAGFKFNDADLLGMPIQVILGEKNLKLGNVEVKNRRTGIKNIFRLDELLNKLQEPI
jgi:prolyl-tRNA synthetase